MDPKDTTIYSAVVISSIIIGLIIIYFVVSMIRQQRKNLELQRQRILAEITTLETERSRMSSDLHDELGPQLTLIKFALESVNCPEPEDQQELEKAIARIDQVLSGVRSIARNLMPSTLTRKGLVIALEDYIAAINEAGIISIEFNRAISSEIRLEQAVNIYRFIQEMIQNTLKHAGASHLLLEMKENKEELLILCRDNGSGFNYDKIIENSKGLGLRNIHSRVEIMGGKMKVESTPEKGTGYFISLPLKNTLPN